MKQFEDLGQMEIFPITIGQYRLTNYDKIRAGLINTINQERKNNKGVTISNYGGWQSDKDLFERDIESIRMFKDALTETCIDFLSKVHSINVSKNDFEFDIWANVNVKGNSNLSHDHTANNNHWSGVFYLETSNDASVRGNTIFEDRHYASSGVTTNRMPMLKNGLPREEQMVPEAGKLIFFPGTLWHRVEEYKGDDERITIAYNFRVPKLENYDFDAAKKSSAFKNFMWYNFRGVMRLLAFVKNKVGF